MWLHTNCIYEPNMSRMRAELGLVYEPNMSRMRAEHELYTSYIRDIYVAYTRQGNANRPAKIHNIVEKQNNINKVNKWKKSI